MGPYEQTGPQGRPAMLGSLLAASMTILWGFTLGPCQKFLKEAILLPHHFNGNCVVILKTVTNKGDYPGPGNLERTSRKIPKH